MDELSRALLDPRVKAGTSSTRVYLNILPEFNMKVDDAVSSFQKIMDTLVAKYATTLLKLCVDEIEIKMRILDPELKETVYVRLIASSFTGGWLTREAYREYLDPITGQVIYLLTLLTVITPDSHLTLKPTDTAVLHTHW